MNKSPSVYGGACIIACVCVGAGMLGLPTAASGAWTWWALLILFGTMIIMTFSGWLLLEAYSSFPYKASFSTVTETVLGKPISIINNLAVYFVGGILLYAYITSAGLVLADMFSVNAKVTSLLYVMVFSFFVWHSTRWVDRISVLLILFMVISFVFGISGLASQIDLSVLLNAGDEGANYVLYVAPMLPIALASFGYHHSVSSLRDYYQSERKAGKALIGGTVIAFVVYSAWLLSIYGNLPRGEFSHVIEAGGNADALLNQLSKVIEVTFISQVISAFSVAAILSSFIGVGLGVFDFLADLFKFDDTKEGRTKTWCVTFIPPLVLSLLFPFGFLIAIGYAAFAAAIWACIIPAALVAKLRAQRKADDNSEDSNDKSAEPTFTVKGGSVVLWASLLFGIAVMVIHLLTLLDVIPMFTG